jgi:hypothetical protein
MGVITHNYDDDNGMVEFFVDGKEFACWTCEGEELYEATVKEFFKVYYLGCDIINKLKLADLIPVIYEAGAKEGFDIEVTIKKSKKTNVEFTSEATQ